jgi:hypothetical protein
MIAENAYDTTSLYGHLSFLLVREATQVDTLEHPMVKQTIVWKLI